MGELTEVATVTVPVKEAAEEIVWELYVPAVIAPDDPVIDQLVPERSLAPALKAVAISASETSMAVVTVPVEEARISKAVVTASLASLLSRTKSLSVVPVVKASSLFARTKSL